MSNMPLSTLSKEFLFAMVQSMYKFECATTTPENINKLMTDEEMFDFYWSYMNAY